MFIRINADLSRKACLVVSSALCPYGLSLSQNMHNIFSLLTTLTCARRFLLSFVNTRLLSLTHKFARRLDIA